MMNSQGFVDGRNKTTTSTENGELHGWWSNNANNEQLNRDFTCPELTDIDEFQVTITFNVYLACRSNIDIIYRRSTLSDGLNIVILPTVTSDTGTTITDTSDKTPSSCTNTDVTKYQNSDQFNAKSAEIIQVSFGIDSTYPAEAVAMGQFTITCYPITPNPTSQPSMTPTSIPTSPSEMPSITPSFQPATQPTKQPTDATTRSPTDVPTLAPTSLPTILTLIPTFSPSKNPTIPVPSYGPTAFPTNGPTMTTKSPTSVPTRTPTYVPSHSPVQLHFIK